MDLDVAPENYASILSMLGGARSDPSPMKWEKIGKITIATGVDESNLWLYRTSEKVLVFNVDGIYYRSVNEVTFRKVLEEVAEKQSPS